MISSTTLLITTPTPTPSLVKTSLKKARRLILLTTPSLTFHLWSSENQIVGVRSRSRRTKPITKRGNVHSDWLILPLLLPTPTIWFSLDHKRNVSDGVGSGVGRKWKRSDSSDSDYVALMTPLTTPIFDFHKVISALTTPLTTPTPTQTPSLVKTSLKRSVSQTVDHSDW